MFQLRRLGAWLIWRFLTSITSSSMRSVQNSILQFSGLQKELNFISEQCSGNGFTDLIDSESETLMFPFMKNRGRFH
jgi:hypothetical protein